MSNSTSSSHILPSFDSQLGGSVRAALNICKFLIQYGHSANAIATFSPGDDVEYLRSEYNIVPCHFLPRSFPARYANSNHIKPWIQKQRIQPDIVSIHGVWVLSSFQAALACLKADIPYVVHPHGSLDPFDLQKRRLQKKLVGPCMIKWLLDNSRGIVCTTKTELERLETYNSDVMRYTSPLPVPCLSLTSESNDFRSRFNIPEDAQVVLFLSRIDYKKGLEYLIPALAMLKPRFPKIWFVLAGSGSSSYSSTIDSLIDSHQLNSITTKTGFLSGRDKVEAFNAANIFALPSLNENFGIVVVEAMNACLPILISDNVYLSPDIQGASAGVICSVSVESVYVSLLTMLDGTVDLPALGNAAKKFAGDFYHPQQATNGLVNIYHSALS